MSIPSIKLPALSFIGGGNMASAMIRGLRALPQCPSITVFDRNPTKQAGLAALGCRLASTNHEAVTAASVVVLATKPQTAAEVVRSLAEVWTPDTMLVSILAGTPSTRLATWLPAGARIVRAMPNLPLAVGKGMVGICGGASATVEDIALVEALFSPSARVLTVSDESRMDAITAVSGSGPAYFFYFAEALVAAAQKLGFTREEAVLLVGQTGSGAWDYLLSSGFEAEKLRTAVTSPGGTTAAALKVLSDKNFCEMISAALEAAQRRGKELAQPA